jgi:hypothetical protein
LKKIKVTIVKLNPPKKRLLSSDFKYEAHQPLDDDTDWTDPDLIQMLESALKTEKIDKKERRKP